MDERREADYFRKETEEAEISQRKRRMTPRERDAFIDEYNAKLLTPEERDRFVQEYNAEHPFCHTDSEANEEAVCSRGSRLLTPKQRDAFIHEYNAGLLTPEERDRLVQEYNAEHPFHHADTETNQKAVISHDDSHRTSSESPVVRTHGAENRGWMQVELDRFLNLREHADGREQKRNEQPRIGQIGSREELDRSMEHHSELRITKRFGRKYQLAVECFENGHDAEAKKPALVIRLEKLEMRRLYEATHGGPPDVRIESMVDIDRLRDKYSDVRNIPKLQKHYRHCEVYFEVKNDRSVTQDQLAEKYGISPSTIGYYRRGREPHLAAALRIREEDRIIQNWASSVQDVGTVQRMDESIERERGRERSALSDLEREETVKHIDSSVVQEAFSRLNPKELTPENLASIIEKIYRKHSDSEIRVICTDISPMWEFEKALQKNRKSVEHHLRKRLGMERSDSDVKLGLVNGILYSWTPDKNRNDMINAWGNQYFYFDAQDLLRVVNDVGARLHLDDDFGGRLTHLNNLMQQMVSEGLSGRIKIEGPHSRLVGEALHFQRDILGVRTSHFEGKIKRIASRNGKGIITNPRFPEGKELEVLRARIIATAVSDCHIRHDGTVEYYEEDIERIGRFKTSLASLGNNRVQEVYLQQNGLYRLILRNPFGQALLYWGVDAGDKTILNPKLPTDFPQWSAEAMRAYLEDMIAEEGFVGEWRVIWNRANALCAGNKAERYRFEPRVSNDVVSLIKEQGRKTPKGPEGEKYLSWGKIKDLQFSDCPNTARAAQELFKACLKNRNRLIDDEVRIAKSLGIETVTRPMTVSFYEKTGRVSMKWHARTADVDSTIRWALLCSPNHGRKEAILKKWLSKQNEQDISRINKELKERGFNLQNEVVD